MALHESLAFVLAQTTLEGQRALESVGQMKAELTKQRHENGRLTMQVCTIVHEADGRCAANRVPVTIWMRSAQIVLGLDMCKPSVLKPFHPALGKAEGIDFKTRYLLYFHITQKIHHSMVIDPSIDSFRWCF